MIFFIVTGGQKGKKSKRGLLCVGIGFWTLKSSACHGVELFKHHLFSDFSKLTRHF